MRRRGLAAAATGLVLIAFTALTLNATLTLRPLPAIDGHFRFLGLEERAEVIRDGFGVPRIEANNAHDLFFLQGYVTAQDRFAQMEAMRSEAPGVPFVGEPLDPLTTLALDAYAAGVTKWVEQHWEARALPAEIALRGSRPLRWTANDSLAVAVVHSAGPTSSCVAVNGTRTQRGVPILAADIESPMPKPGWYELGLDAPGLRGLGISLPGAPGIAVGHNGSRAWALQRSRGTGPGSPVAPMVRALSEAPEALSGVPLNGLVAGCLAFAEGSLAAFPPFQISDDRSVVTVGGPASIEPRLRTLADARDLDVELLRHSFGAPRAQASSARIVIDLGDLDATKAALSTGQSGHPAARHYGDQRQLWAAGQLHRLAWTRERIARVEGVLVLRPR